MSTLPDPLSLLEQLSDKCGVDDSDLLHDQASSFLTETTSLNERGSSGKQASKFILANKLAE